MMDDWVDWWFESSLRTFWAGPLLAAQIGYLLPTLFFELLLRSGMVRL
jgi:hypothetical protein